MKRRVVWHDRERLGAEHCSVAAEPGGFRLEGVVTTSTDGDPLLVEYVVRVDVSWRTRRAEVRVNGGGGKDTIILLADGYGGWWRDAQLLPDLQGCLDLDLGITPSTHTLPIRRLLLQPGQTRRIEAASILFPDLTVVRAEQAYERVDSHGYIFRTGRFESDLEVDDDGIVTRYAKWTAIAAR